MLVVLSPVFIYELAIVFFAGLIQGLTGFGFALIAAPSLLLVRDPAYVVPVVLMYGGLVAAIVALRARKWLSLSNISYLTAAGLLGLPVGVFVLEALNAKTLKLVVGTFVLIVGITLFKGYKKQFSRDKLALVPIGFLSGVLATSTSLAGPPVILFFTNQELSKQSFRANIAAYFVAISVGSILTHACKGLLQTTVMWDFLWLLPALLAGASLGMRVSRSIDESLFQRLALVIALLAGLLSIASGLDLL